MRKMSIIPKIMMFPKKCLKPPLKLNLCWNCLWQNWSRNWQRLYDVWGCVKFDMLGYDDLCYIYFNMNCIHYKYFYIQTSFLVYNISITYFTKSCDLLLLILLDITSWSDIQLSDIITCYQVKYYQHLIKVWHPKGKSHYDGATTKK